MILENDKQNLFKRFKKKYIIGLSLVILTRLFFAVGITYLIIHSLMLYCNISLWPAAFIYISIVLSDVLLQATNITLNIIQDNLNRTYKLAKSYFEE